MIIAPRRVKSQNAFHCNTKIHCKLYIVIKNGKCVPYDLNLWNGVERIIARKNRVFFLCYNKGGSGSFYNTIQDVYGLILNARINLITIKGKAFISQAPK